MRVDMAPASKRGEKSCWGLMWGMMHFWSRYEAASVVDQRGLSRYLGRVYRPKTKGPGVMIVTVYRGPGPRLEDVGHVQCVHSKYRLGG